MRGRPTSYRHARENALAELLQFLGDLFFVGHLAERVYVDVAADAPRVDDDDRALGPTELLVEHPARLRHLAMRPMVRANREFDAADRFSPRLQRVHRVAQHAHDLTPA